jgi:hypothetical protein
MYAAKFPAPPTNPIALSFLLAHPMLQVQRLLL